LTWRRFVEASLSKEEQKRNEVHELFKDYPIFAVSIDRVTIEERSFLNMDLVQQPSYRLPLTDELLQDAFLGATGVELVSKAWQPF
jgi:hypothetical protein